MKLNFRKYSLPILASLALMGIAVPAQAQMYGDVTIDSNSPNPMEVTGVGG
jgi:hypothetical protein